MLGDTGEEFVRVIFIIFLSHPLGEKKIKKFFQAE